MPPQRRLLQSSSSILTSGEPPEPMKVDSDLVFILAALLCALICVVGLTLAARCAWLTNATVDGGAPSLNKGIKKKDLRTLPKTSFDGEIAAGGRLDECPICLSEFVLGDEIRILPQCGHGFHVRCVDTWLRSHTSCPFCRQILVVAPPSSCRLCGGSSAAGTPTAPRSDSPRTDSYSNLH